MFKFPLSVILFLAALTALPLPAPAVRPEFSTAGFFALPHTGRQAYSMNPAWRLHKGALSGNPYLPDFDDSRWTATALPDGLELLPPEASGCVNYQGEAWYRKHFTPHPDWQGRRLFLHFEGIMGKSKVWVNGHLAAEHYGGYLPVIADITSYVEYGRDNVVAVWTDNSNDPLYPPGKPQQQLDFAYFGGIYRDCWLVVHNPVYITDPNYENVPAGGGLFVSFGQITPASAEVRADVHVRNLSGRRFSGRVSLELFDSAGQRVAKTQRPLSIQRGAAATANGRFTVTRPHLWSPDNPYLYNLHVYVLSRSGDTLDGYRRRIGIRSIEFKGAQGFWLNGKPYPRPLIGANRHQDFAVIGNALPNSLHWRDAKKLRDAGLEAIRNAHYPQDPAFMDACDELGLLVIVNTPGWQFWNNNPLFGQRVYSDIRNMVRRDRNHPCVWLWEPILNETPYPADFARNALNLIREEYPHPYCYAACDATARGHEAFSVRFDHPRLLSDGSIDTVVHNPGITYFTREWGDNVDDWSSHNSPSRASRAWGEVPMLIQAQGYARPNYPHTCLDALWRTPKQHVGGCLWHAFDHQRGYHPDPFYGGIMDAFRQPKLSYYMFAAQRPIAVNPHLKADNGPMVYIAHAMTPFSPQAVTVYSNCPEVRLTLGRNGPTRTYRRPAHTKGMPAPIITFDSVWNVMTDKALARSGRQADSYLLAEGLVNGRVVATHKVSPTRRPTRLLLWADDEGVPLQADGSDAVVLMAAIADNEGRIKRLSNQHIRFEVMEGSATLVADSATLTNPSPVRWGTAPILLRAGTQPGRIKVRAAVCHAGPNTPAPAELELTSVAPHEALVMSAHAVP